MTELKKYIEIFDYLSSPHLPQTPESTIIFGRQDERVAQAAGDLVLANLVDVAVITGGIGKDSGDLTEYGYRSEAHFLAEKLRTDSLKRGFTLPDLYLDEAATNGGENARNSINILNEHNHTSDTLTAVAHATSARRLTEMLRNEGKIINNKIPTVFIKPTSYDFDASNTADQKEARDELLRLYEWPTKEWLLPQTDLPDELVEFANDEKKSVK